MLLCQLLHKEEQCDFGKTATFQSDFCAKYSRTTRLIHKLLIFWRIVMWRKESKMNLHFIRCFSKLAMCFISPRQGSGIHKHNSFRKTSYEMKFNFKFYIYWKFFSQQGNIGTEFHILTSILQTYWFILTCFICVFKKVLAFFLNEANKYVCFQWPDRPIFFKAATLKFLLPLKTKCHKVKLSLAQICRFIICRA